MKLISLAVTVSLAIFTSFSCKSEGTKVRSPHWGKDTCEVCRMVISEVAPAAQLVGPGVQMRYYDDLGCAVNAVLTQRAPAEADLYVVSPSGNESWVEASKVFFVAGQRTPMDYGFLPANDGQLRMDDVITQLKQEYGKAWRISEVDTK